MFFHPDCFLWTGKAEYKCNECNHFWKDNPGFQGDRDKACPVCPSQFCTWLNFRQHWINTPRR